MYMYEDDEQYYGQRPSRFLAGFVSGVIVSAIAVAVLFVVFGGGMSFFNRSKTAANTGITQPAPASPAQPASLPPAPAATPPAEASSQLSAPLPAASPTPPQSSSPSAAAESLPAPPGPSVLSPSNTRSDTDAAGTPPNVTPGADEVAEARRYLNDRSHPGDAEAARHLWSAVEKGNLTAEIMLADMYSRGQGVTKNCNQARVLLRAAAQKGSQEASQHLAQVIRNGC
jgi:TPR repeat protein